MICRFHIVYDFKAAFLSMRDFWSLCVLLFWASSFSMCVLCVCVLVYAFVHLVMRLQPGTSTCQIKAN